MSDQMDDRAEGFGEDVPNPLAQGVQPEEAGKSGVTKAEPRQKVLVSRDRSNEQVLQLNLDEGLELVWDKDSFRELPQEVERQLRFDNLKNYLRVQFDVAERAKIATKVEVLTNPLNPLGGNAEFRLRIRPRQGWHQCWKTPGNELDAALAGPYRQVRKLKETGKKNQYGEALLEKVEPGYENGEVLKLMDENGKVELVAVECPQQAYEDYLVYMAKKSRSMYTANEEKFEENVEELNRHLDKDKRMRVINERDGR